jgi:sulfur-oxidizing protein SoxZ
VAAAADRPVSGPSKQEIVMAEKPRIKLPKEAKKGEIIQIKTLVAHIMESGQRRDKDGKIIPRMIINTFTCTFNDRLVFSCGLESAIAANPYLQFSARVQESGTFKFGWVDDNGTTITAEESITVA